MPRDLKLHPEHGLNPTVPVCFWCGQDKEEVVLLGAAYKGEAPSRMLVNYEPCPTCKANMERGIVAVELVDKGKTPYPPMAVDGALAYVAPTGRWVVLTEDAVRNLFPNHVEQILASRKTFVDGELFQRYFGDLTDSKEETKS